VIFSQVQITRGLLHLDYSLKSDEVRLPTVLIAGAVFLRVRKIEASNRQSCKNLVLSSVQSFQLADYSKNMARVLLKFNWWFSTSASQYPFFQNFWH
jgi:hypothetical protein